MKKSDLHECPLSKMARTGDEASGAPLRSKAWKSAVPKVCGETLVYLEDCILDEPVRHKCYGVDRSLWFLLQLKGMTRVRLANCAFDLGPDEMVVFHGPGAERDLEAHGRAGFQRVTIKLGEDLVRRYFERDDKMVAHSLHRVFSGSDAFPYVHRGAISAGMHLSLQQLFQSPHCDQLGSMFIESRALDIACSALASIMREESESFRNSFTVDDIKRLRLAHDALLRDITSAPPSISDLSREVGLNEYKLKRGFRSLFGETLHAYHRNARMDMARSLILSGCHNVCEVACAVGYSNPSHFSRAFHNRFSVNPGEFLRDLRNGGFHYCAAQDESDCSCN